MNRSIITYFPYLSSLSFPFLSSPLLSSPLVSPSPPLLSSPLSSPPPWRDTPRVSAWVKAFILVTAHGTASSSQWSHCARSHRWCWAVPPPLKGRQSDRDGTSSASSPHQCPHADGRSSERSVLETAVVGGWGEAGAAGCVFRGRVGERAEIQQVETAP